MISCEFLADKTPKGFSLAGMKLLTLAAVCSNRCYCARLCNDPHAFTLEKKKKNSKKSVLFHT